MLLKLSRVKKTVRVRSLFPMVTPISVNLKMGPFMVRARFMLQVEKSMKVGGRRVKKKEKGHTIIPSETPTMVSGKMIKRKDRALTSTNSVKNMRVSGKMI